MAVERAEQLSPPQESASAVAREVARSWPAPRLFDVDEYYRMAEVGILKPDERLELIEGEIYTMSPIGDRHGLAVSRINVPLVRRLADRARIDVQNPVRLAHRVEPQPDFCVSRLDAERPRADRGRHPRPADIYLLIEVADTTLAFDLGEKAQLYARYGVSELWVLDLPGDRVLIHREPTPDGYASVVVLPRDGSVSPLAFPDMAFTADDLLGPPLTAEEAAHSIDDHDSQAPADN